MSGRSRQRYTSLQASISLGMIALGIFTSVIVAGFYYYDISNQAREDIRLRLRDIINIVALRLNAEELDTVVDETDVENEFYVKYQKELTDIIKSNDDLIYIYTMRKDKNGTISFYIDTGGENYVPDPPGVIPYEQPTELLLATFASPSGTVVETDLYTDEFGTFISAYTPIFNQDGSLESILAVDMKADTVTAAERNTIRKILIYFGITFPLIILSSLFLGYRLSRPAVALTTVATRIARITEYNAEPIASSSAGNNKEAFDLIQTFNRMSGELHNLIQNLEQRVAERTADLRIANQKNERRANQFEAIAQIAQATTSVQEIDLLLPRLAELISTHLGNYHTGIFLLDSSREYAVLRGTNSPGGQKMMERSHKLKVGQTGLVGFVAATGTARIALDVGADAAYFDNPDLPTTHSEIALPMIYARQIIGILDVQSTEKDAFGADDIEVLSTLANQVAIAIQNAGSLQETQKLLAEAQSAVSRTITEAWKILQPRAPSTGYQTSGASIKHLEKPLDGEHIRQAIEQGKTIALSAHLAIPIRLRDQVIGVINLQVPEGHGWSADQVDIAEAVAERLSLAIETSTLLHATQRRANIERITADISGKIGSSTHVETILQTAAQELSRALGGSDVLVQIEPVAMKLSSS